MNLATDYLRGDVAVKGGITTLVKTAHLAEAFRTGNDRWLVAVKQVSEGVDIARLSVCLWACSFRTPLFFAQLMKSATIKK